MEVVACLLSLGNGRNQSLHDSYLLVKDMLSLAASEGAIDVLQEFLLFDARPGLSEFRVTLLEDSSLQGRRQVTSNLIGAAAYYNRAEFLGYLLKGNHKRDQKDLLNIDELAKEHLESSNKGSSTRLRRKFQGLTPVQLGVVNRSTRRKAVPHSLIGIIDLLGIYGANLSVKDKNGNNLIQLAVKHGSVDALRYLVHNTEIDIATERNVEVGVPSSVGQECSPARRRGRRRHR